MRNVAAVLLPLAILCACSSNTVLVTVPPRMDLKAYPTLGIVQFTSNASADINARATRQFQEQVQAAQPGTRFIEVANREALLDADALRRVGDKYGVAAVFVGEIVYSEPKADIRVHDLTKVDGTPRAEMRAEMRAEISSRLVETRSAATVWTRSASVSRPLGRVSVSAARGMSGGVSASDPRAEMLGALVHQLTRDFRPSSVRQPAN